jgi:two-component system response regulator AtoC
LARTNDSVDIRRLPPAEVIFGRSSLMAAAREKLQRVADTTVPVLLQGESGTGKEVFARLLHAYSRRANSPWIKVNCPAIPHSLIESELFGYERGAFTGAYATKQGRVELAHMGTLFLDEVGSLDLSVQAKLLQVLQDGGFTRIGAQESRSVNTRLISASRGNLRQQTNDGTFRLDFFFRINAVTIELPSLRQRVEDLPALIDYFFEVHSKAFDCSPKPLSREILRLMQCYDWPGNIRQLENLIRSYILIGSEEALAADLVLSASSTSSLTTEIDLAHPVSLKKVTRAATQDLERQIILKVLQANGWSRLKTAKWLNISYRSLLYKLQDPQVGGLAAKPSKVKTASRMASMPQTSIDANEAKQQWFAKAPN